MRKATWWLFLLLVTACADQEQAGITDARVPVVPFDSLFALIDTLRLGDDTSTVGAPADLVTVPEGVMIADAGLANLAVFDLHTGVRIRVVGRPGDGPGEFRAPAALAVGQQGSVWVMDRRRKTLSLRTATGEAAIESMLIGRPSGMTMSLAGRIVLFGRLRRGLADSIAFDAPAPVIHEVDSAGSVLASRYIVEWPTHPWQASFANYFGTAVGSVIVAGSFHSGILHFEDLATGRSWSTILRAPWFREPEWPTDSRALSGQSSLQEMNSWLARQTLVHRLTNIGNGQVAAEIDFKEPDSSANYGYIIVDTAGRVLQSTGRTSLRLLRLNADTLLGLRLNDDGTLVLERRMPNRLLLVGDTKDDS